MKNKLLEAMALGLPVVSYPDAVVGIDCEPGVHLLVADTAEQMAESVQELLLQPERARQIARSGRRFVEDHYGWESSSRRYEALYEAIVKERVKRTTRGATGD
jgi:glycosyltransferase involved in cell wall biosynthesis